MGQQREGERMTTKSFRVNDAVGPDYFCSGCNVSGLRLWRDSHTFLNDIDLLCAECAEAAQREAIARYACFHQATDPTIGNLVPARPTPEGDTFWGHTSGDVEWWYALPQYLDPAKELDRVRIERDDFMRREQQASKDWLKAIRENGALRRRLEEREEAVQ
jgi:hypothetical protein